jgi:hypothetical protein
LTASLALASLLPHAGLPAPQQSILPPDSAARPFLAGRDLVEKGRYREAVPKLEEAIRTGHEKPAERFGTSRHSVDYYDPHYWLGRALMELGDEAGALLHLRASAADGDFPNRRETEDRARRITELENRQAARLETPAPGPSASPAPTPVPFFPSPPPTPPALTPTPTPPLVPVPTLVPTAALPAPASSPSPVRLDGVLAALAEGDFDAVERRVRAARIRSPGARELDLVEAAAFGSRYVLEGRRDAALLATARARLTSFRQKGGSVRAEATLISPSLRALLEPR